MLRSMKALHQLGYSRRAACDWQLGWFSEVSDSSILLMRFHLSMCWGIGLVILSCLWCRRTQLDSLRRITCFYCLSVILPSCVCTYQNGAFLHCSLIIGGTNRVPCWQLIHWAIFYSGWHHNPQVASHWLIWMHFLTQKCFTYYSTLRRNCRL